MLNLQSLPVVYNDLSNENYHNSQGLSSTQLKTIAEKSYAHFIYEQRKESKAKDDGSRVHMACLESEEIFNSTYLCSDAKAPPLSHNKGKDAWKEYCKDKGLDPDNEETKLRGDAWKKAWFMWKHDGKQQITKQEYDETIEIIRLMQQSPIDFSDGNCLKEHSIYWKEEFCNKEIILKARPDMWFMRTNELIDLKTIDDARLRNCNTAIYKYNYHWSLVFHAKGIEAVTGQRVENLGWVFVEKKRPFAMQFIQMPEEMRAHAEECVHKALKKYATQKSLFESGQLKFPYGDQWKEAEIRSYLETQVEEI